MLYVAHCSATGGSVGAKPPVPRTPSKRQLEVRHPLVRAARVQNETAPEKLLNRYEKRFEKCEKGSEKRSETRLKNF